MVLSEWNALFEMIVEINANPSSHFPACVSPHQHTFPAEEQPNEWESTTACWPVASQLSQFGTWTGALVHSTHTHTHTMVPSGTVNPSEIYFLKKKINGRIPNSMQNFIPPCPLPSNSGVHPPFSPSFARLDGFLNQQLELGVVASNPVLALGVGITS